MSESNIDQLSEALKVTRIQIKRESDNLAKKILWLLLGITLITFFLSYIKELDLFCQPDLW